MQKVTAPGEEGWVGPGGSYLTVPHNPTTPQLEAKARWKMVISQPGANSDRSCREFTGGPRAGSTCKASRALSWRPHSQWPWEAPLGSWSCGTQASELPGPPAPFPKLGENPGVQAHNHTPPNPPPQSFPELGENPGVQPGCPIPLGSLHPPPTPGQTQGLPGDPTPTLTILWGCRARGLQEKVKGPGGVFPAGEGRRTPH